MHRLLAALTLLTAIIGRAQTGTYQFAFDSATAEFTSDPSGISGDPAGPLSFGQTNRVTFHVKGGGPARSGDFWLEPPVSASTKSPYVLGPAVFHVRHSLSDFPKVLIKGGALNGLDPSCDSPSSWSVPDFACTTNGIGFFSGITMYFHVILTQESGAFLDYFVQFRLHVVPVPVCAAPPTATSAGERPRDNSSCSPTGVDHIEIIQTVQDEKTSVPLIANKPTLVRVFVRMNVRVPDMTAVLHASRGDKELSVPPGVPPLMQTFLGFTSFDRADLRKNDINFPGGSVDFNLPVEWLYEGDEPLYVSVELKLPDTLPTGVKPDDPNYTPSGSLSRPLVTGRSEFRIGYISFCSNPLFHSTKSCPTDNIVRYDRLLRKTYPISNFNVIYRELNLPESVRLWPQLPSLLPTVLIPEFPTPNAYIRKLYDSSVGQGWDQLIGFFPTELSNSFYAGIAELTPFKPRVVQIIEANIEGFNDIVVAHEIAHNLGRQHTGAGGIWYTTCGDKSLGGDWPYKTPYIQEYGWDSGNNTIMNAGVGDFMSYCKQPNWISPSTFNKLLAGNLQPHSIFPVIGNLLSGLFGTGPAPRAVISSNDQIIISGFARRDGSAGGLDPVYHVVPEAAAEPSIDGGSHCLHFTGPQGALGDYCFPLNFVDPESLQPVNSQYFSLKAPFPPGATRIALVAGTKELAALAASSAPPVLTITSPQPGNTWNPGQQTIIWSASDPDGNPLTYAVLYSSDGGQSWLPLVLDITDSQFTFDPAQIDGGANVKFRVMATSGLSSTSVDVGPITVVQTPTLSVAQTPLDFGRQLLGEIAQQSLTISNTGSGPLNVSSLTIDGRDFQVASGFAPLVVPAGGSRTVGLEWTVPGAGAQNATLSIASNDPANPVTKVALTGAGSSSGKPQISVSPSALVFGSVAALQQSALAVTVTNKGDTSLNLKNVTTSGPFLAGFSSIVTLPPGASKDLTVVFQPLNAGAQTGTLTITSNDPMQSTTTVALSGTGAPSLTPQIAVSSESLDFGSVPIGRNNSLKLTITNTGGVDLHIASVTVGGNAAFSGGSTKLTLPAGKSADVTVTFTPTATGVQQGTLTISSDDPLRSLIQLTPTGTGVAGGGPTPGACVAPAPNLVSWWPGDGNAVDSTGGNSGTVQGGTTFAAGEVGQAFQFDGSTGYVSAGNPANLRLTSAITIEAWINPRTAPTSGNIEAVVTKWAQIFQDTADSDSYGLWFDNDATVGLSLFGAIHQSGGKEPHVLGGTIPLNAWTHVAMTFDSTTGQFVGYVNGRAVSTLTSPGPIITSSRNVFIGREDSILPRPFNGLIDEASVYGRALSASEIQAIYAAGSAGKCKGTTGGGTQTIQLSVDDGTYETLAGFPNGAATAYFVNRLTPPSYPATLRSVQIVFLNQPDGLKKGELVNIVSGGNPGGSTNINNIPLVGKLYTIAATDAFNSFDVAPVTIQSGDFVIGFSAANPPNFYPMAVDTSSGSKSRSYISTDGTTFTLSDASPKIAGNFGIRATVDVPGTGVSGPKITTTASSLDFGSVPVNQSKTMTPTINNGGGGTLTVTSLPPLNAPFALVSPPQTPFNLPVSGQPITVSFSPTAAGSPQTGALKIGSNDSTNDPSRSTLSIPLTGAGTATTSTNPLSANLVGLFAMNEGSGTTDKNLVDGQLATFSGAKPPTWNTSDPSIVFQGGAALNSYLNAGTDPIFDQLPTGQMTIVARIFATTVAAAGICEKNDGNSADGFAFGVNGADGGLQLTVEKSGSNMRLETVAAVTAGKWMQVAVTWDGTRGTAADAHIYVNGVEQKYVLTNPGSGTLGFAGATNQPFRIGTAAFDFPGSWNGKMAYLAVYKGRILTPAEMAQLDLKLPLP